MSNLQFEFNDSTDHFNEVGAAKRQRSAILRESDGKNPDRSAPPYMTVMAKSVIE